LADAVLRHRAVGTVWVVLWWGSLRPADLALPPAEPAGSEVKTSRTSALPREVFRRRFLILITLVVTINMSWHFLRFWHPTYLRKVHEFSLKEATPSPRRITCSPTSAR